MSQMFVLLSAVIIGMLGLVHLIITFVGNRMHPRDPALMASLENTHLMITRQTSFWRGWIGFNASHSMGAMLFGAVYGYLAWAQPGVLWESAWLLITGCLMLLGWVVLAWRYWFVVPLVGMGLSLVLYVTGVLLGVT